MKHKASPEPTIISAVVAVAAWTDRQRRQQHCYGGEDKQQVTTSTMTQLRNLTRRRTPAIMLQQCVHYLSQTILIARGRVFRAGEDEQQQSTTTMATTMIHQEVRNDIHFDHNLAEEGVNQIGGVNNVS